MWGTEYAERDVQERPGWGGQQAAPAKNLKEFSGHRCLCLEIAPDSDISSTSRFEPK